MIGVAVIWAVLLMALLVVIKRRGGRKIAPTTTKTLVFHISSFPKKVRSALPRRSVGAKELALRQQKWRTTPSTSWGASVPSSS